MSQLDLAKVKVAGSAEEVREIGMSAERIYTCGPERFGVKGCPIYHQCTQPEKDKQGFVMWMKDGQPISPMKGRSVNPEIAEATREGPGPMELGVTLWKITGPQSSKVVNRTCRCWEYPQVRRNWEASNQGGQEPVAGCKVTAIEGQKFFQPGSIPETQPDGKIIHVIQGDGVEAVIKPFPRPRENRAFAASAFAVAELERETKRMESTNLRDVIKLRPNATEASKPDPATPSGPARGASSRG